MNMQYNKFEKTLNKIEAGQVVSDCSLTSMVISINPHFYINQRKKKTKKKKRNNKNKQTTIYLEDRHSSLPDSVLPMTSISAYSAK